MSPIAVYIPKGMPYLIRAIDAAVGATGGLIPVRLNGEYATMPVS